MQCSDWLSPFQGPVTVPSINIMSKRRSELEGRLNGLLSRIAMETQEIKELEQLLTDGQILANEILKRDLEGVICGFEKYLGELRQQAQSSQQQVDSLQSENQTLRLHLEEARRRCRQLEHRHTQVHVHHVCPVDGAICTERSSTWGFVPQEICSFREEVQRLQAQLVQNQAQYNRTKPDQITAGEDRLADSLDHKPRLQVQLKQDQNWRLEQELQRQSRHGLCRQKLEVELERSRAELQAVQQERDVLQQQMDSLADDHQRRLGHLNRRVRQLRRSMSDADQLTAEQLRALNYRMELLQTQVCADSCEHKRREKKKKLRLEASEQQHRRHGSVLQVCDEVECVEKTLLKRRAELREADRRLLEAQRCVHATRDQAAELQSRVQNSATCLLEAAKHLRTLQEEEQQLLGSRQKEQQALVEVEEMLRRRTEELQQLTMRTDAAADRLADVLSDCQEAQRRLDSLTCQKKQNQKLLFQEERRGAQSGEGERRLAALKAELITQRAELLEQQALTGVENKHTQRKEALQQEVGNKREEAASHLHTASQHQELLTLSNAV
ncbi:Centriolin [Oryzias melastigma]|uniref:Centriolin n=1 Tax=Oryzias melastigma TaxID=30732 RepID=A0A834F2A8_ORYME|nr:Centriolin [Oryzias melastigma]